MVQQDEEIKTYVKSLLEGANLELITMKKVCQDVYAHYPDFDLAHKKDFIKTTVKNVSFTHDGFSHWFLIVVLVGCMFVALKVFFYLKFFC